MVVLVKMTQIYQIILIPSRINFFYVHIKTTQALGTAISARNNFMVILCQKLLHFVTHLSLITNR